MDSRTPEAVNPASRPERQGGGRRWVWALVAMVLIGIVAGVVGWRQLAASRTPGALGEGASAGSQGGAGGWRGGPGGMANRTMPVRAEAARRTDVDVKLDALGTVTPQQTVTVRARVSGLLQRVHFQEGQVVKAGELLAEIDPRPFEVQLAQAEGNLARDQALLANAKVDLARYEGLVKLDAAPRQQLDSQAALVRQYEGAVATDRGAVEAARLDLSFARITAPASGRIGLRAVDAGNMVNTSDANGIAVITQVQPIGAVFALPQDQLPAVLQRWRAGEKLPVQALDRDGKTVLALGTLATVDNLLDVSTGTVKLKALFSNEDQALFPNQFVNVRLRVNRLAGVVTVSEAAVQRGTPGTFVYVVRQAGEAAAGEAASAAPRVRREGGAEGNWNAPPPGRVVEAGGGTVSVRRVKLGAADGGRVVVTEGLKVGEVVVIDGADKLREGAKVEVITGDPVAAAARPASGAGRGGRR